MILNDQYLIIEVKSKIEIFIRFRLYVILEILALSIVQTSIEDSKRK